jgi:hypothetical protein
METRLAAGQRHVARAKGPRLVEQALQKVQGEVVVFLRISPQAVGAP